MALTGCLTLAQAQNPKGDHWVSTWTTAQLLARTAPPPAAPAAAQPPRTPQAVGARGFNNQTVRMIVRTSIGGRRARVKIANAFGGASVTVGAAHIAVRSKGSEIVAGSDRPLSFNGKPGCMVGPGMVILSDPVDLEIPQVGDVAVSLYFPGETGPPTTHATGLHNAYIKDGDATAQPAMADAMTTQSYYFLAGVDVLAPRRDALIVAYGDSITDGARSTPETDHSWPALLAARFGSKKKPAAFAIGNMGIGGNRVLRDGTGSSALARFDRDVLGQSGVAWVMLLEGINDIGRMATVPAEAVTADELIGAYKQLIERAHTHGLKIAGCTLLPFQGASYYREPGEAVREAVNNWIRTSGAFDAVVDFEAATRDPANPKRIKPEFDPGDHLHPNDAGYQAMANAVDLQIFNRKK
ncbi:MAG: SGNH/GDSL hydrolase family protein [Acidobacteriia bacterium]|nr:SGNH/GDSL hydrolase family protein [Terriglobia bacterium]